MRVSSAVNAFTAEDAEEKREPINSEIKYYKSPQKTKSVGDRLSGRTAVRSLFALGFLRVLRGESVFSLIAIPTTPNAIVRTRNPLGVY